MNVKWPELALRWKGALGKYRYVWLVIALGMALLMLPPSEGGATTREGEQAAQEAAFVLDDFEEKLGRALSAVQGAGETRVVLTLDGGSRRVLARDREQDGGGVSSTTVTLGRGGGSQEVVPLQTMAPSFRGALVICPGGDDPAVRLKLMKAVSALTGLGADRVSICAGN